MLELSKPGRQRVSDDVPIFAILENITWILDKLFA